jgi:tetratricopeptide (TPR) repeat protein
VQDFSSSIEDFNKAIAFDPKFTLAYFDLAVVYTKQLDLKENVPEYDKKSEQPDIITSLGGTNTKKEPTLSGTSLLDPGKLEYDLIVKNYGKVIELNPEFVYAYYNRAEIRYKQNDFRAAILDYNEAIRRDPQFAEAYYNRGLARFRIKDKDRALDDMRKAGEMGVIEAYSIIKRMTE